MPEATGSPLSTPHPSVEGELIGLLRRTLGRLEAALATISDALVISDAAGRVMWCNQAFEGLVERPRLFLLGQPITAVLPPDAEGRPLLDDAQLNEAAGAGLRAVLRHAPLWAVAIEWRPVLAEPERPLVFCIRDISADLASEAMRREVDRIAAERLRFEAQARVCAVTGLANRRAMDERLAHAFAALGECPGQLTLLFCDLNGFKQVNDQHGHAAGDALLLSVGRRLQRCLRSGELVARLGGDEFVVLSEGPRSAQEALDLGVRLLEEVCRPWIHEGRHLLPSMSVGIAITADAGLGASELLRRADLAMYDAKGGEQPSLALHDSGLERRSQARQRLAESLRQALADAPQGQALHLRPLPVVGLGDGLLQGHEVLPWLECAGEPPCVGQDLLILAGRLGLTARLGRWLRASALVRLQRQASVRDELVAFGIGAAEFAAPGVSAELAELVGRHALEPARIAVLLDDALLCDPPAALPAELEALRRLGVQLVLDGFGAGRTPLQALERLPLTAVRLHPDLIGATGSNGGLSRVAVATVRLARELDLEVIATGIETVDQRQQLEALGCRWGQGTACGPPAPAQR